MPSSIKSNEYHRAFCATPEDISALWKVVKGVGDPPTLRVRCSDGSTITWDDVDSLKEFANVVDRRIIEISIASDYGSNPRASASISAVYREPFLKYEVQGEVGQVLQVTQKIEERFTAMEPWFGVFSVFPPFFEGAATAVLWLVGVIVANVGSLILYNNPTLIYGDRRYAILLAVLGWALFVFSFVAKRILRLLFPAAVFAIGEGTSINERAKWLRKVTAGLLGAGVLAIWSFLWGKAWS